MAILKGTSHYKAPLFLWSEIKMLLWAG